MLPPPFPPLPPSSGAPSAAAATTKDVARTFDSFWASARPVEVPAAALAALPEYALLRRSSVAADWLSPYNPFVSAAQAAAMPPPPSIGPADLATSFAVDFSHRSSHGGGRRDGGPAGAGGAGGGGAAVDEAFMAGYDGCRADGNDDGGGASDVEGVGSELTLMLMAGLHVPLRMEGTLVCGVVVGDVVVNDRVRRVHSPGMMFDPSYLFVCDVSSNEYLLWGRSSNGAVIEMESFTRLGNTEVSWLSSVVRRPAVAGALPTLLLRTTTLLHRTVPWGVGVLPAEASPLAAFRAMMEDFGAFGCASVLQPPVSVGGGGDHVHAPLGGEGWREGLATPDAAADLSIPVALPQGMPPAPSAAGNGGATAVCASTDADAGAVVLSSVFQAQPTSMCLVARLHQLALSARPVQPARLVLGVDPLTALRAAAAAAAASVTAATTPAGELLALTAPPALEAPTAAAATNEDGDNNSCGGDGGGAPAPGQRRRRRRRPVDLDTINDERLLRRILRNRLSAANANEARRVRRLAAAMGANAGGPPPATAAPLTTAAAAVAALPPSPAAADGAGGSGGGSGKSKGAAAAASALPVAPEAVAVDP
ncbi:hypothetical protein MMPV_009073 [Pyropia vietnamensis]